MIEFQFTNKAKKEFDQLNYVAQNRVIKKLTALKNHSNIMSILKNIYGIKNVSHRMRIGNLRLLILHDNNKFIINKIGYRQNFYS